MELYMCGFNAHHQLQHSQDHHQNEITQFRKVLRSPHLSVRCALWSSTVLESDGTLIHQGYRPSGLHPVTMDGPPPRNIRSIFGDTSGVLGALATDGSLYVYHDGGTGPEFKKHRFPEDSFIVQQRLAIEHLAIADNGEVCTCTNNASQGRQPRGNALSSSPSSSSENIPRILVSAPTAKIEIRLFPSFQSFLLAREPATATHWIQTPLISLLASATGFTALTATGEVLTFGSPLHPLSLGRDPTASDPADSPRAIPFFGGVPIAKVAVGGGGWIGAAVSRDRDLYLWGGRVGAERRIKALPTLSDDDDDDGEIVRLVDIDGRVDIVDVGVGSGHVLALTAEGQVWAAGDGGSGQLGTGSRGYEEDWVRVRGEWEGRGKVVGLGCGVWSSWIVVETRTVESEKQ